MIVRRMSAHQMRILNISSPVRRRKINDHAGFWSGTSSPKAEVGRSNRLRRANNFNALGRPSTNPRNASYPIATKRRCIGARTLRRPST